MDSKEILIKEIICADTFEEYSKCMKTCMDVCSIICDDCPEAAFNSSYGATIARMGDDIVSDPKKVRDEIVQLLNDEIESCRDIFLTYKFCVAIELLDGSVTNISDSSLCVTNLLSCVDEEKLVSYELFSGFAFLKGVKL